MKKFYLLKINDLSENELNKLNKFTKVEDYNDKLYVYEVGNKGVKSKVVIDTINKNDLDNYKNI